MESIKTIDQRIGPVIIQHHPEQGIIHKLPSGWSGKKVALWKKRNQSKIREAEVKILNKISENRK